MLHPPASPTISISIGCRSRPTANSSRAAPVPAAKGMHYNTQDGRKLLDGTAGLWCVNAGHERDPIVAAIPARPATRLRARLQFSHPKAFELAARIAALAPGDLDHVFFGNSGRRRSIPRSRSRSPFTTCAAMPGRAADRPGARLPRRRLRRHRGRRHRLQPQHSARCCPVSITCRTPITSLTRPSPAASPSGARISRTTGAAGGAA